MRARLRDHLNAAMRERDRDAVSALRAALAAIENAEAVAAPPAVSGVSSPHIAGALAGVGSGEAARRELSAQDVVDVVTGEVAGFESAAAEYEALGRPERADELRRQAAVLRGHLDA